MSFVSSIQDVEESADNVSLDLLGEIVGSDVLAGGAAITQEEAIANPESWTLFALACYLGTRFPDYTWASTKSKLRQS